MKIINMKTLQKPVCEMLYNMGIDKNALYTISGGLENIETLNSVTCETLEGYETPERIKQCPEFILIDNLNRVHTLGFVIENEIKRLKPYIDELINQMESEETIKINYDNILEPFNDDYFKGLDITAIAELAKKSIRLTTENRKLEDALDEIEETIKLAKEGYMGIFYGCDKILDIIANLRTDETKCNPDSEQIERDARMCKKRNAVSVEQIQDSKAKGVKNAG